ncbi:MAG: MlaD family protein [Thermodesulfobacteriota bacterium]
MASQKTKFSVGLFVASGMAMVVVAIIWLGMSRYLEKGNFYATYFDESVQGLQKGAPVKYRGVSVGHVEDIGVAPDERLIQVVMKIETDQELTRDIVAQLKDVGFTGSMFVELDRKMPVDEARSPQISFPSEYPIVASKPSEMREFLSGIDELFKQIKALDLPGVSAKVKLTLDNMNQVIGDAQVKEISTRLQSALDGADRLINNKRWTEILAAMDKAAGSLDGIMDKAEAGVVRADNALAGLERMVVQNEAALKGALEQILKATQNANELLQRGATLVERSDQSLYALRQELMVSAQNLAQATDNLNRFMEILADQPSQLLLGEPPRPRFETK